MDISIPSSCEVRQRLAPLKHAELQTLAKVSGVPFTTLWKIRSGETQNPGIDTVRKLLSGVVASGGCGQPSAAAQEPTHAA